MKKIVAEELNVKEVGVKEIKDETNWLVKEEGKIKVALDTKITEELKKEGLARELVRAINQLRKDQKLTVKDAIRVEYQTDDAALREVFKDFGEEIKRNVLAKKLSESNSAEIKVEIDGKEVKFKLSVV